MSDLIQALAALRADLPPIRRTAKGQVGTRNYRYAAYDKILATVRPIMAKHGFAWHTIPELAVITTGEPRFVLTYVLTHLPSGEDLSGQYPLREGPAQQQGSEISYAKRYALAALLDLQIEGEDDDGMAASEAPKRERTRTKIPGPEHERLRHSEPPDQALIERVKGPAPDSRWDEAEHASGSIGDKQRSRIMRHLGNLSSHDRALRLQNIIGREDIDSTNDLSWAEAAEVIKILEA
jgi:hypothetical protein